MKSQLTKAQDGTITLTIALAKEDVAITREKVLSHMAEHVELAGFRKGKAPRNLVEEKIDPLRMQEDILKELLPKAYSTAVLEHHLKPIMNPKIHVGKLDDGNPPAGGWEFSAITAEMPDVILGEYKKDVKDITAKTKIAIPGEKAKEINMDELMQAVLKNTKITVPSILLESEVDRLLSQLLDEVKTLGLSLDQYLASTHKTVEQIKKEYEERARQDIMVEFVLQKIAEKENISISEAEIEEAITKATTPAEKENLEKNKYLLAAILRQQKTFDYLKNL